MKTGLVLLTQTQLQLEQNKGLGAKELSAEQLRFYKLALMHKVSSLKVKLLRF